MTTTVETGGATSYTFAQLESLWIQAGGDPNWAPLMAGVAFAESGGFSASNNLGDSNGGSYGLWQINGSHYGISSSKPPDQGGPAPSNTVVNTLDTPIENAKAAVALFNSKPAGYTVGGWVASQWTDSLAPFARAVGDTPPSATAVAGVVKQLGMALPSQLADAGQTPPATAPNQGKILGSSNLASGLGQANPESDLLPTTFGGLIPGLGTLLKFITSSKNWKRVGEGLLGAALLVGGLILFVSTTGTGKKIESTAELAAVA